MKKDCKINLKDNSGIGMVFTIIIVVIVLLIISLRIFLISMVSVRGDAMEPAFKAGDYLLVRKFGNKFERGDIVICLNPKVQKQMLIKRIVGLPNEKIELKNEGIFVDGQILSDLSNTSANMSFDLDNDEYFVLNDNINNEKDSRTFGPIKINDIKGKVFFSFKKGVIK